MEFKNLVIERKPVITIKLLHFLMTLTIASLTLLPQYLNFCTSQMGSLVFMELPFL